MCTITNFLWDQLLEQAELTLNLMRKSKADPIKLSQEYLHGSTFNYDTTPIGPLGIPVIIHNKPIRRKSWDYIRRNSFSAGVSLNHYYCQQAIDAKMKAVLITDTIEFHHHYLTQPSLTPQDRLIHALQTPTFEMNHAPAIQSAQELQAINHLQHLFQA